MVRELRAESSFKDQLKLEKGKIQYRLRLTPRKYQGRRLIVLLRERKRTAHYLRVVMEGVVG